MGSFCNLLNCFTFRNIYIDWTKNTQQSIDITAQEVPDSEQKQKCVYLRKGITSAWKTCLRSNIKKCTILKNRWTTAPA